MEACYSCHEQRHGLRYLLLERATIASTIRDYPRDKAVLAEPVLLPQYGLLNMMDTKKETLIAEWENVIRTKSDHTTFVHSSGKW